MSFLSLHCSVLCTVSPFWRSCSQNSQHSLLLSVVWWDAVETHAPAAGFRQESDKLVLVQCTFRSIYADILTIQECLKMVTLPERFKWWVRHLWFLNFFGVTCRLYSPEKLVSLCNVNVPLSILNYPAQCRLPTHWAAGNSQRSL